MVEKEEKKKLKEKKFNFLPKQARTKPSLYQINWDLVEKNGFGVDLEMDSAGEEGEGRTTQ